MVDPDRGDHGDLAVRYVRGVPGAAHPDLDHRDVDRRVRERGVRHRDQHLEVGQPGRVPLVQPGVDQVDVRGENIGRRISIGLGVIGDVRATIQGLLPLLRANRSAEQKVRIEISSE